MFLKSKPKNPTPEDLQDFGLFKKTVKSANSGDKKSEKNRPAVAPEDVIDVDVVDVAKKPEKAKAAPVVDPIMTPEPELELVQEEPVVTNNEDAIAEDGPAEPAASPFGKKNASKKPGISIKTKSAADGAKPIVAKKESAGLFGFLKKKAAAPTDDSAAPANKPKPGLAGLGKKAAPVAGNPVEKKGLPFNVLSIILAIGAVISGGAAYTLYTKNHEALFALDKSQTALTADQSNLAAKLGAVAGAKDEAAALDVITVLTRAKLLDLPGAELSFKATNKVSDYTMTYFLKDPVATYDFSKFKEAEFPSFTTGAFGQTCKTNNGPTKQGDKDVFIVKVQC